MPPPVTETIEFSEAGLSTEAMLMAMCGIGGALAAVYALHVLLPRIKLPHLKKPSLKGPSKPLA